MVGAWIICLDNKFVCPSVSSPTDDCLNFDSDVFACVWIITISHWGLKINFWVIMMVSVLWRCWLGGRKGIRPVKTEWWGTGSFWSEVQTCIWPSWCHCHSLSLAPVKSRLVLLFWIRLTQVVLEKRPLNGCSVVVVVIMMVCNHGIAVCLFSILDQRLIF